MVTESHRDIPHQTEFSRFNEAVTRWSRKGRAREPTPRTFGRFNEAVTRWSRKG